MTSIRKATPLHMFVLATVLAASGGVARLNQSLPGVESLTNQVQRILPAAVEKAPVTVQEEKPAVEKRTPADEKRARFATYIEDAAKIADVPAALIEAVITAESAFNPLAISRTGAVGLMQLMPATAKRFGVKDRTDPAQNILGGAKYLKFLLAKFDDEKLAIAAYNAGEGNVMKHGNKIPPFAETQKYVPKVLAFYEKYSQEA
jgi:soluble lytic murein transglycosylase-like protein